MPASSPAGTTATSAADFVSSIENIDAASFHSEADRNAAKVAAEKLLARLETPWETFFKYAWGVPGTIACLHICTNLKLFPQWAEKFGPDSKQTVQSLANLCNVDEALLARILRHMATQQLINLVSEDTYSMNAFDLALRDPGFAHAMQHTRDMTLPGFSYLPEHLAQIQYRNPTKADESPFAACFGEPVFKYLPAHPEQQKDFQEAIRIHTAARTSWLDIFHADDLIKQLGKEPLTPQSSGAPSRAWFVDVGGGQGLDVQRMRDHCKRLNVNVRNGALVLQDLPSVIAELHLEPPIVAMGHDITTEQPVKGASIFYIHTVLHNWPDAQALTALQHLRAAMDPAHSRLLIHETVLSRSDPHAHSTSLDMVMMMMLAAQERTESMWTTLLEQAGLKVKKIWEGAGHESIIEAVAKA